MTGWGLLRESDWLTPARARAYGWLIAVAVLIATAGCYGAILRPAFSDPRGRPIASDFDAFWAGGHLAAEGGPAAAYDLSRLRATETIGAQTRGSIFYYLYPPVWLMLCRLLGALPYGAALALFLGAGYAAMLFWARRLWPAGWPMLPVIAFPAAMLNAVIGQNGFVTAGCFAGAALLLERRPVLGGACLGLLVCKPHLALCVPLALLLARRWVALVSCGATALGLVLLSWAELGSATWLAFFAASGFIRHTLLDPGIAPKLISVFAAVRVLRGGVVLAAIAQGLVAVLALLSVGRVAWRRPGARAEVATVVAAAMLCTPYLMDYDLVCLAVPMAWLAGCGAAQGWRAWEKLLLAVLYLWPLAARTANLWLCLPITPLLLSVLLLLVVARATKKAVLC